MACWYGWPQSEQSFQVGDLIKIGDTQGLVLSIDLLSIKLRTFDNQLVRIPNEALIKDRVNNLTRFPLRRFDINLGVAYKEDVGHVNKVLSEIARKNTYCLDEPDGKIQSYTTGRGRPEIHRSLHSATMG